jgi:drug/metabolite transporter (DMT)-like permease
VILRQKSDSRWETGNVASLQGKSQPVGYRAHLGLLAVLAASLLLSSGPTLVRRSHLPGSVLAFWRLAIGAVVWQLILAKQRIPQSRNAWRRCLPAGVCFGLNIALFFTGVTRTRVANAEFIGTLTPLIVIPIAAWRLRERLPRRVLCLGWWHSGVSV